MLDDIKEIRKRKDYKAIIANPNNSIEGDEIAKFEEALINSPYNVDRCTIPDPEYIIEVTDTETLEQKIQRILRGDRVGIQMRKGTFDMPKNADALPPEVESALHDAQAKDIGIADLTVANVEADLAKSNDTTATKKAAKADSTSPKGETTEGDAKDVVTSAKGSQEPSKSEASE